MHCVGLLLIAHDQGFYMRAYLVMRFFSHSVNKRLSQRKKSLPEYVPGANFRNSMVTSDSRNRVLSGNLLVDS